jgi:putative transposase
MTNYRRNYVPGGSYFFTVNLLDRRSGLLVEHIALLRRAFRAVRTRHPFKLDAIVILPDHLHAVMTLPSNDVAYPMRWRLIKTEFSRALPRGEQRSESRASRGERGIWQRRYWEHTLRNEADYERHVDYIHWNPVKHGWVRKVGDWRYSSFPRYAARGDYPVDWCGSGPANEGDFGEA